MGVYINLTNKQYQDHPDWDWGLAGNRDYASLFANLPREEYSISERDYEYMHRPTDFEAWRKAIREADLPNTEEYLRFVDLLEGDPQWWIYISY